VGTALAVIIPEGVDAMYSSHSIESSKAELHDGKHECNVIVFKMC